MNLYGLFLLAVWMLVMGMAAGWVGWLVAGKPASLSRSGAPNWTLLLPLGIAGSFVAGLGASLLAGEGFALRPAGMIASVIGAVLVVWLYSVVKK